MSATGFSLHSFEGQKLFQTFLMIISFWWLCSTVTDTHLKTYFVSFYVMFWHKITWIHLTEKQMAQHEIQGFLLSSKVKLESHSPARSQCCTRRWQIISVSFPRHSFWVVISIYFVTIAALNHVSCFPYFPCRVWFSFICSQAGITLSFYFSAFTARDTTEE